MNIYDKNQEEQAPQYASHERQQRGGQGYMPPENPDRPEYKHRGDDHQYRSSVVGLVFHSDIPYFAYRVTFLSIIF